MARFLLRLALVCAILSTTMVSGPALAATPTPPAGAATNPAQAILAQMTPAERVGQLFVVGFFGASAGQGTAIYDLVANQKVGGVILVAADDNITDTVQPATQVLSLTNQIQAANVIGSQTPRTAGGNNLPPYVPLLVAINHEGDGYPFTDIQTATTAVPNEMAIGATWDPAQAEATGRIVGTELAALGINVVVGPSLDVLETPRPEGADLGTRVFGGDPYWVGLMGQAYIRGVHTGSAGAVATIAKHFPGHGGSDRQPDQELPTVRKSLDDLKNFDLVPFYAVTGNTPNADSMTDGLLDAHIRFQGFQGNIRQNTAPVSFDAPALGQLLGLPEIAAWRGQGGVTMSDSLGVRAIKSFYDPTLQNFYNRRIARDAFNAGNDLLLLTDFGLNPRSDQTQYITDTLAYFQQQYQADQNFAANVDAAVLRILNMKLRLSGGQFNPGQAERPLRGLSVLNRDQADLMAVAQAGATLISPSQDELVARAPEPPTRAQHIVFFTDVRQGQQCSTCGHYPLLDKRQLEQVVVDLYGRGGSGQVGAGNLASFSFDELAQYLQSAPSPAGQLTPTPEPSPVEAALQQADWLVFAMLNVSPDVPSSSVVSTFLAQRPDMVRSKKIVVFGFNAPYYLDTTDLSKLTAFYALYSRTPAEVTVAARLLFRDLTPRGAAPVSVPGIGYRLIDVTRPDPKQIIALDWQSAAPPQGNTATAPSPGLHFGDTITLTTGIIHDLNGHPVPDQTPAHFRVFYTVEGLPDIIDAVTVNGVATATFQLNRTGLLEITASSEPALASKTLLINVQQGLPFIVTEISPTSPPTASATVTPSSTPPPPTATLTPAPVVTPTPPPPQPLVDVRSFMVMLLVLGAVFAGGYRLGTLEEPQARLGLRVALVGGVGVLAGYNYFALALPGASLGYLWLNVLAAPIGGLAGGILGLAGGWYWFVGRSEPGLSER